MWKDLAGCARLALALCHARLGHEAKALRVLRAARGMYDRVADSAAEMAHVTWMEGQVAAATGNLEDAPGLLDSARRSFLKAGKLYEAGFASLELAAVLARSPSRLETIHPLIHDVVEAFPTDVKQAGVLRVLEAVEMGLAGGRREDLDDVVALAAETLRRFRRNPLLVFGEPRQPRVRAADPPGTAGPVTDLERRL